MSVTVKNPYPASKPLTDYVAPISGYFSSTKTFKGFIPGRRYAIVISGYDGHVTEPRIKDGGVWGPALLSEPADSFWNDEIVMPTDSLQIAVTTAGTGDLHFSAQIIAD